MSWDDVKIPDDFAAANSTAVRSGDWLGEWEAALALAEKAWEKTWAAGSTVGRLKKMRAALDDLRKLVDEQRTHSPSDQALRAAKGDDHAS